MDHAINHRRAVIDSASSKATQAAHLEATEKRLASSLDAKRIRAINTLGNRWVLHPRYNAAKNAHHNPMHKSSAVLSCFLHLTGAVAEGRV